MEYHALLAGVNFELFGYLKAELEKAAIGVTFALTASDGARLYAQNRYDLALFDLRAVGNGDRLELLEALRRAKPTPILVLTDTDSDEEEARMIDLGVDFCLPDAMPPPRIAKYAFSLIRRYTTYNHYDAPDTVDAAPFSVGNIFIDPLRRTVRVRSRPVELRPREFSLLLYFMRNPGIVLSTEQICEHAWGMEYPQGAGQSIYDLRQKIEPDPNHPIYIETVHRVGYRFTAYNRETCGRKETRRKEAGKKKEK